MTHDQRVDDTWNPDAGENAVILQPGVTSMPHAPLRAGPSVEKPVTDPLTGQLAWRHAEFATDLSLETEPLYIPPEQRAAWPMAEQERYGRALGGPKIGGSPIFIQDDEFPFADWRLLLQLDGRLPFSVNFGDDGSAWAIANAEVTQVRFLWQCY